MPVRGCDAWMCTRVCIGGVYVCMCLGGAGGCTRRGHTCPGVSTFPPRTPGRAGLGSPARFLSPGRALRPGCTGSLITVNSCSPRSQGGSFSMQTSRRPQCPLPSPQPLPGLSGTLLAAACSSTSQRRHQLPCDSPGPATVTLVVGREAAPLPLPCPPPCSSSRPRLCFQEQIWVLIEHHCVCRSCGLPLSCPTLLRLCG